jgi:hypothetical protein
MPEYNAKMIDFADIFDAISSILTAGPKMQFWYLNERS